MIITYDNDLFPLFTVFSVQLSSPTRRNISPIIRVKLRDMCIWFVGVFLRALGKGACYSIVAYNLQMVVAYK